MRKRKLITLLTVATMSIGILTGCSNNKNDSNNASEETRIVNSAKGEVEIPANPERIVDISGNSEELVVLGYTPVGTSNVDSYNTDSVPAYVQEELGNAKVVGHSMMDTADIESILGLNPDLIIMAPRQEKIYDQLKEIAPVVMLDDEYNDWEAKLMDVADIFDKEEEAQAWLDTYYAKAETIGKEIKTARGEDETYAVLSTDLANGQFYAFTNAGLGTVLKEDLDLKQPENMPGQDSIELPKVTMEGLAEIDADNLIIIGSESDKAELENSSVWNQIRAVKEGNVIFLNQSPHFSQAYNPIGRLLELDTIKEELVK
ncbi:ABC transporter substrate-binding protein [Romboutsia sp. CE17]|uniref:ABC transporter substrate-binding protein n=1 Tax=Romboutsia sp. CE17 TaxID=2724150 RepID=UPI001442BE4D|nr:ABC transporter substrate-binding protein [Romboutsia sp. CE17]QJA09789.1 ABC transporter substrate-binding protein [Romboutsia sp. CE17]